MGRTGENRMRPASRIASGMPLPWNDVDALLEVFSQRRKENKGNVKMEVEHVEWKRAPRRGVNQPLRSRMPF
ncbi:hypothetical protein STZ1_30732 [Bacillus subtilis]